MKQAIKDKTNEAITLNFSRPLMKRLERVDEPTLASLLDDLEADQEIADAITHSKNDTQEPRPMSELRAELKAEGLL